MDLGTDSRRLAVEIIATLVHLKRAMADLILRPAGISDDLIGSHLYRRDPTTGRNLSKREMAPGLLGAVEKRNDGEVVTRRLIEIAAQWSSFHLADDEFAARAVVQKARELLGTLELMEAREREARDVTRREEIARMEKDRAELFRKHSDLLLMMFDDLSQSSDHQKRGYLLQDLLNRLFDLYQIPVVKAFTRNEGGEQIDGAFKLEGWHYLVECRWRKKLADIRAVDGLLGQVSRSGKQTMGVYLSINGWSSNVPALLKQNTEKGILVLEGHAVRCALARQIDWKDYLTAAVAHLSLRSEPYLSVTDYLATAS
jgi:hypothetical protein